MSTETAETTGAAVAPETTETPATWIAETMSPMLGYDFEIGGVVVEFDLERPRSWEDFERHSRAAVLAFAEGADRVAGMARAVVAATIDVRGLPEFAPRERDEAGEFVEIASTFRGRLMEYFEATPEALVPLAFQFNADAAPTVRRRTFR